MACGIVAGHVDQGSCYTLVLVWPLFVINFWMPEIMRYWCRFVYYLPSWQEERKESRSVWNASWGRSPQINNGADLDRLLCLLEDYRYWSRDTFIHYWPVKLANLSWMFAILTTLTMHRLPCVHCSDHDLLVVHVWWGRVRLWLLQVLIGAQVITDLAEGVQ